MSGTVKERRLEIHRAVAGGTVGACRPKLKLSSVRIFMTVCTTRMSYRFFEVAIYMAFIAAQVDVFSGQAKMCQIMIKVLSRTIILPAYGVVTCLAPFFELQFFKGTSMRTRVTAFATVKRKTFKKESLGGGFSLHGCTLFPNCLRPGCLSVGMAIPARLELLWISDGLKEIPGWRRIAALWFLLS
jgi:hypothetical protein